MVYLVIMFIVAAAGITRLWLQQRKERAHLETVDGFRESLESISATPPRRPRVARADGSGRPARPERASAGAPAPMRHAPPPTRTAVPRYKPLDPERRAAAKRRLEARRKARARAGF
ncbi:MAG: hypothetical protein ACRDLB_10385 [Actinomycetota bacterium]